MSEFVNTTDVLGDDAVCDGLITKTLAEYADNRVTSIGNYAFYNCAALISVNVPAATTIGIYSFYNCDILASVNMPAARSLANYAFYNCYELSTVYVPAVETIAKSAFRYCSSLVTIDLPVVTSISTYAFYSCAALTAVIIRSDTLCTLDDIDAFVGTPIADGTGYIYVPSALVDEYTNGTNWSEYSSQIRAIEDYPDITGG